MAARWLVKTEPSEYGFDDLARERRTLWTGVENAAARKHLAAMRRGDAVLVYHTGKQKAVVGEARVSRTGEDGVELEVGARLPRAVALAELKAEHALAGWDLLRLPRLSVMPVSEAQWEVVVAKARAARG